MEYTEDADHRELLLHSAYDSDTVRAMRISGTPLSSRGRSMARTVSES